MEICMKRFSTDKIIICHWVYEKLLLNLFGSVGLNSSQKKEQEKGKEIGKNELQPVS
jgi:hypothetical protein